MSCYSKIVALKAGVDKLDINKLVNVATSLNDFLKKSMIWMLVPVDKLFLKIKLCSW